MRLQDEPYDQYFGIVFAIYYSRTKPKEKEMSRTLNLKTTLRNTVNDSLYASEYSEAVFNAMSDDAVIIVYAKLVKRTKSRGVINVGRKHTHWTSMKFQKRVLNLVGEFHK